MKIGIGTRQDVGRVSVPVDHLIGGSWVSSPQRFETSSPMEWEHLADMARGDDDTADAAVAAAVEGFEAWSSFSAGERADVLYRLANLIEAHNDDIALVETLDMGFLYESMKQRLVARGALNFHSDLKTLMILDDTTE